MYKIAPIGSSGGKLLKGVFYECDLKKIPEESKDYNSGEELT